MAMNKIDACKEAYKATISFMNITEATRSSRMNLFFTGNSILLVLWGLLYKIIETESLLPFSGLMFLILFSISVFGILSGVAWAVQMYRMGKYQHALEKTAKIQESILGEGLEILWPMTVTKNTRMDFKSPRWCGMRCIALITPLFFALINLLLLFLLLSNMNVFNFNWIESHVKILVLIVSFLILVILLIVLNAIYRLCRETRKISKKIRNSN